MEKEILIVILAGILLIDGLVFIGNMINRSQCANNITEMGRNYKYDFINGCRVQQNDGTYIFWEMYRSVNN